MRCLILALLGLGLLCPACGAGGPGRLVLSEPPPVLPGGPAPQFAAVVPDLHVVGGEGGMAPHAVHVRANLGMSDWADGAAYLTGDLVSASDGAEVYACSSSHTASPDNQPAVGASWGGYWQLAGKTGAGWWAEGRWQFAFLHEDGSAIEDADNDGMRVTDPLSGQDLRLDNRYSAAPTAAYVFRSPGAYQVRVRFQNKDKEWSDWARSASISVAPNARTQRFVDGNSGSDQNDGASPATAKSTLDAALRLVTGNDFEIIVADGTEVDCTSVVDTSVWSGLWIHGSGVGPSRPVLHVAGGIGPIVRLGSRSTMEGFHIQYPEENRGTAIGIGVNKSNVTFADMSFSHVRSILEVATGSNPSGLLLLRLNQVTKVSRYGLYIDGGDQVAVTGCSFAGGSDNEHTVRIGSASARPLAYASVEYSVLDYADDDTGKSCFRCYARHVGVYRSILARGTVNLGNIDTDAGEYRDYCIDGCQIVFDGPGLGLIVIWENLNRVVIRTSYIRKEAVRQNPLISISNNSQGGTREFRGLRLLNCSIANYGTGNNSSILTQGGLSQKARDCEVRGLLISHSPADTWTWGRRFVLCTELGSGTTPTDEVASNWRFADCVLSLPVINEFQTATAYFTVGEEFLASRPAATDQAWAGNLIVEEHTFDEDAKPLGTGTEWRALSQSSAGVFLSLNGVEWTVPGPVGAYYPTDD